MKVVAISNCIRDLHMLQPPIEAARFTSGFAGERRVRPSVHVSKAQGSLSLKRLPTPPVSLGKSSHQNTPALPKLTQASNHTEISSPSAISNQPLWANSVVLVSTVHID